MSHGLIIVLMIILGIGLWQVKKYHRAVVNQVAHVWITKNAFEHTALGMAIVSPDCRFLKINRAYGEIIGYTRPELLKMAPKDLTHPEDQEKDTPYLQEVFAGNIHSFTTVKRYVHKNGNTIWVRSTLSAVRTERGNLKYFVAQIQDMTIAKNAEDELRKSRDNAEVLARTDYLTKTLNRRAFIERLQEELERTKRTQEGFAMILVDIDYFKKVNDQFGHLAGDYVLQKFADCLSNNVRPYDFIGRYGGEEFIICLPDTDVEQAALVAERMRESVEALEVDYLHARIKVTGSFGVAVYDSHSSDTLDELIEKADGAMYVAKNHKNTVYQWVS